ncbi:MAG TPA: hypothetical protein VFE62_06410 [Gemmataceae bacterium]|nr:hypothetical protein [Gemmataceae bacterium]
MTDLPPTTWPARNAMRRRARAVLLQLVAEMLRDGGRIEDVEESVSDDILGAHLCLVIKRIVQDAKVIHVTGQHRRIVSVLDYATPKTQFQIYVKLGKYRSGTAMSGGFRTCCADLVRWGVTKHVDGGYVLCKDAPADALQHFDGILPKPTTETARERI